MCQHIEAAKLYLFINWPNYLKDREGGGLILEQNDSSDHGFLTK